MSCVFALSIKYTCLHPKPKAVANFGIFSPFQSPKSFSVLRSFQADVLFFSGCFHYPLEYEKNPLNFTWSLKNILSLCSYMSLNITRTCFSKIVKIRCKHRDRTHNLKKMITLLGGKKTFTISHDREKSAYRHVHLSGYLYTY